VNVSAEVAPEADGGICASALKHQHRLVVLPQIEGFDLHIFKDRRRRLGGGPPRRRSLSDAAGLAGTASILPFARFAMCSFQLSLAKATISL